MSKSEQPEFLIRLRGLPDSVPVYQRLKRFLKMAIRGYGLVCVHSEEIKPSEAKPAELKQ
jgi:hypothetical protein